MKKQLLVLLCAFMVSGNAFAETFQGYSACLTEELYDQMSRALMNKDFRSSTYLLKHGCIITKKGIPITVLKKSWYGGLWLGGIKVRAYIGDEAIVLWTDKVNIGP